MEEEIKAPRWCSNLWTTAWVAVLPKGNLTTRKINGKPNNSSNQVLQWTKGLDSETVIWRAEEVTLVAVKMLSTQTISSAIWVLECPLIKWVETRCSMAKVKVDNVKCRPTIWMSNHNKVTEMIIHPWEERPTMACPQEIWMLSTSLIRECFQANNSNRTSWAKDLPWIWGTLNKTSKARACSVALVSKIWWWTTSKIWWEDNSSGTTSNMGEMFLWRIISWTRGS